MFTRDWASEPVPSRGTSKDRRRQMEGEQLKREAEERAGRSLGEERYADRDRYADRRYDRGGDRYGDRGGDRYGDRGGDRYGDRGGDRYGDGPTLTPDPRPNPRPSPDPHSSLQPNPTLSR